MNYKNIYEDLINRSKNRSMPHNTYCESHHIIPKCMGGTDAASNLVLLTGREHYIAHLLLAKIYPTNAKIIFAANMMCNRNNRHYEWVKQKFSVYIKQHNRGYVVTDDARQKMSERRKNVPLSKMHRLNIAEAHKHDIVYNNVCYRGYAELESKTGITSYLYKKYFLNGIDPTPYIKNHTHGIRSIDRQKIQPALGKVWINNGEIERYTKEVPPGWVKGRLKRK